GDGVLDVAGEVSHLGFPVVIPEAGSRKPEARSQKPEARSQKPEARSQKPEARSLKPQARYQPCGFNAGSRLVPINLHTKIFLPKVCQLNSMAPDRAFMTSSSSPKTCVLMVLVTTVKPGT